jgi:ketosteroid isomerase-like protein
MLLLAAAAAALSAPLAVAATQAEATAAIVAFADAFDRAQLARDAAALDRMVSDDLVFIDGSGARQGKKAFIAGWTAPGDRFEPIRLIDRTFTPLGPNAWIVGAEVTLKGTSDGKPFASRFRFADTFRRTGGQWRAVHIQVTRIP